MGKSLPLESAFKYVSDWNKLLGTKRFTGIVVDGEEKAGFINEMNAIPGYKTKYNIATFGYAVGYTQVGVFGLYGDVVDAFYLEMYDFYVYNSATLQLVQNSDVGVDKSAEFITELNANVWTHFLPYYEYAKVQFMWSVQDSANTDCYYPDSPSTCGIKKDFGAGWTVDGYLNFIAQLNAMYPNKFGNKPHGIFQFSFIPLSWFP